MKADFASQSDQVIRYCTVTVTEPDIHDPSSDARRVALALADQYGVYGVEIGLDILRILQSRLRQSAWSVQIALNKTRVVIIQGPDSIIPAGLAIDIGASSIELSINNLVNGDLIAQKSIINPLIRYGSDPISRVAYGMTTVDGFAEMTATLRSAINTAIGSLADEAGLSSVQILDAVFVADPVTHHVMLGLDATELGTAPYTQAVAEPSDIQARELGLHLAPGALVHALPLLGGHVGSDCLAAAYQCGVGQGDEVTLLVDIGTTTEIMVGSKGRLFAAAPPAGSALEGVQLEAGRHAVPGALRTLRIDPETYEPRYQIIGSPYWSDEPEFRSSVEALDVGGFCRAGLIDALAELRLTGLMGRDGTIDPDKALVTSRIREEYRSSTYLVREAEPRIALTQHDIRSLQMAKAAVQASARILLKRHGGQKIDRIVLTGGSGVSIDPLRAAIVGLFPDCDPNAISFVENAALLGAKSALLSRSVREGMARLARETTVIETVLDPDFQAEQIGAMGIPHRSEAYPLLATKVELSDNEPLARGRREGRRNRG